VLDRSELILDPRFRLLGIATANRVVFAANFLLLLRDRPRHDAIDADVHAGRGMRGLGGLPGRPGWGEFSVFAKTLYLVHLPFCYLT